MNTCNNCKWMKRATWFSFLWIVDRDGTYECAHPETLNSISGKPQECFKARNYGACGNSGRLFEARNVRAETLEGML